MRADVSSFPETSAGTFSISGDQLTFTESGTRFVYFGTIDGNRITATMMDVTFVFARK